MAVERHDSHPVGRRQSPEQPSTVLKDLQQTQGAVGVHAALHHEHHQPTTVRRFEQSTDRRRRQRRLGRRSDADPLCRGNSYVDATDLDREIGRSKSRQRFAVVIHHARIDDEPLDLYLLRLRLRSHEPRQY